MPDRTLLDCPLIYHPRYDLNLGAHVFPSEKFRLVHDALIFDGLASVDSFLPPEPAADQDVLRVHTPEYIHKLKTGTLSYLEKMRMEIPYSPQLIEAVWLAAGGSTLAARKALATGRAANIGGGFHHAFPDHGEGFCVLHDVAIAIRAVQATREISTAMIIDTDVHHGNGTAAIFANDATVFTLSIHQEHNYPIPKPPSDIDINLEDGVEDDEYLDLLENGVSQALRALKPDLVFYIAGADPYEQDQLGGLRLTMNGLKKRDALVFRHAREHHIPFAIALAGGYARRVADTVRIHVNTLVAASESASTPKTAAADN